MAISLITSYSSNFSSASSATLTETTSYSIGANQLALVAITLPNNTAATSVTDTAGHIFTLVSSINNAGSTKSRVEVWRLLNTTGASITVTPKVNLGAASRCAYVAGIFAGMDSMRLKGTTSGQPSAAPSNFHCASAVNEASRRSVQNAGAVKSASSGIVPKNA